jgi:hypothetical protein
LQEVKDYDLITVGLILFFSLSAISFQVFIGLATQRENAAKVSIFSYLPIAVAFLFEIFYFKSPMLWN